MPVCKVPFETLYLHRGWASTCCPNWYGAYNATPDLERSPEDLWREVVMEYHRTQILRGDYSACRKCPLVNNDGMKALVDDWEDGPKFVHIADSFVCNLHCWSCRKSKILAEDNPEGHDRFLRRFLAHYRDRIEEVSLLNNGEVFASERHVRLLNEFDWGTIRLAIITNATLIDRRWPVITKVHSQIAKFTVSLDASNEETYGAVRLGGSWAAAVRGMELIKSLGRPLYLHYVVSDKNAHDIARFAEWAQQWNPERIELIPLARTYPRDDWDDRDVFRDDHPLSPLAKSEIAKACEFPNVRVLA